MPHSHTPARTARGPSDSHRMPRFVSIFVLSLCVVAATQAAAPGGSSTTTEDPSSATCKATFAQSQSSSTAAPSSRSASPAAEGAARPRPKLTLPGVKPLTDRSNSTGPVPCTCGIFMSKQCARGAQPKGLPPISHEFDRATAPSAFGNKQCTNACVDMIVRHLPNSSSIVCASIGRDCFKEKAYLYIKNNGKKWIATNLSAGREYCCKDGVPYKCPITLFGKNY